MKKLFSICVVTILAVMLLAVGVSAEEPVATGTIDNIIWTLDESGSLYIDGDGEMPDFTMDENGKSTAPWYQAGVPIRSVFYLSGIPNVGAYAFAGDADLSYVDFPYNIETIGEYAFYNCTSLNTINHYYITNYEDYAFAGCQSLSYFNLDSPAHIGTRVFYGCSALHDIYLPSTISSWGVGSFENSGLSWVDTELGLQTLGEDAFRDCGNLESISIANSVTGFGGETGNVFTGCTNLTVYAHAEAPAAAYAAANSISFEELEHRTGAQALRCLYCGLLTGKSGNLSWHIDEDGNMFLYGNGELNSQQRTWKNCKDQIVTLTVEEGVVGEISGFDYCENLVSVSLPEGITAISVFNNCTSLEKISIPSTVTNIDGYTFEYCTALKTITLPEGLTNLGRWCFTGCNNLQTILLPASLQTIGNSVFLDCNNLDGIWVSPDNQYFTSDDKGVLYSKDMTTLMAAPLSLSGVYTIPQSVTTVQGNAFRNNTKLTGVILSDLITRIEPSTFSQCTALESITFPENLISIDSSAFYECTNLKTIYFTGPAPLSIWHGFLGVTATVYYPAGDPSWTEEIMASAGGNLTWVPMGEQELEIVEQPKNTYVKAGETAMVTVDAKGSGLTYQWYVKNAGQSKYSKSSVTGPIYSCKLTDASKDRLVYCQVTDQAGNSIKSKTVIIREKASITAEPSNTYVKSGSTAKVSVKASGDGLKYQWYIKNDGQTKYSKSSITSATYSCKMSDTSKNRLLYCIVTDAYGNQVKSKTVILREAVSITTEPSNTYVKAGATAKIVVKASGDGLKYQWYIKNAGGTKYSKSSITSSTYSCKVTDASKDRLIYCVVTDAYGNQVKSKTVILREAASITQQPQNATADEGATVKVNVKAAGDGLKYQWYIKNANGTKFSKSSVTGATYSCKMSDASNGRQVYCVVTDAYGRTVTSNTATLSMSSTYRGVYANEHGTKYHYDPDCAGKSAYPISLSDAAALGKEPCSKCVG